MAAQFAPKTLQSDRQEQISEVIFDHYLTMHRSLQRGQLLSGEACGFRYAEEQLKLYQECIMAEKTRNKYIKIREICSFFIVGSLSLVQLNMTLVCQLWQFPHHWTSKCKQIALFNILMTNWFALSCYQKQQSIYRDPLHDLKYSEDGLNTADPVKLLEENDLIRKALKISNVYPKRAEEQDGQPSHLSARISKMNIMSFLNKEPMGDKGDKT